MYQRNLTWVAQKIQHEKSAKQAHDTNIPNKVKVSRIPPCHLFGLNAIPSPLLVTVKVVSQIVSIPKWIFYSYNNQYQYSSNKIRNPNNHWSKPICRITTSIKA